MYVKPNTYGCGVAYECIYVWSNAHICVAQCRRTERNANNSRVSESHRFFIQCTNRSSHFHATSTLSGHEAGTLTTTQQIHQIIPTNSLHVKIMYILSHKIHQNPQMSLSYVIFSVFFTSIKHIQGVKGGTNQTSGECSLC